MGQGRPLADGVTGRSQEFLGRLMSRDQVVAGYRKIALERGFQVTIEGLGGDELPPFYLHHLCFSDDAVGQLGGQSRLFTGVDDGFDVRPWWSKPRLATRMDSSLLSHIPLPGHALRSPSEDELELIGESLSVLERAGAKHEQLVRDWLSLIVWVGAASNSNGQVIAGATLPFLPHASFFSAAAADRLPPDHRLEACAIGLADHLYHEAVHQRLSATMTLQGWLPAGFDTRMAAKVPVPWRNVEWSIDRALHAAVVYASLHDLRCALLDARGLSCQQTEVLQASTASSAACFSALVPGLAGARNALTEPGRAFLDILTR